MSSVLWRCLQWPGHEVARLDGKSLSGLAAFAMKGEICSLAYKILCDDDWKTRAARVSGWVGERRVDVLIEAREIRALDCVDIDLNFSPSTNTLPIRRLNLGLGQTARVSAAWLRFPSFALERLDQQYTRLTEDVYRYDNAASGFTAELRVRSDGLVLDYGDIWKSE